MIRTIMGSISALVTWCLCFSAIYHAYLGEYDRAVFDLVLAFLPAIWDKLCGPKP